MRGKLIGVLISFLTVIAAVIWIIPVYWMFVTSLKFESDIFRLPPIWFPTRVTIEHYVNVFKYSQITVWFFNSVIVSITSTLGVLVIDSFAAYAFTRIRFWGRNILFSLVIASLMVPHQVTIVPLFCFISSLGLVNKLEAVVIPWIAGAFGVFLLRQFFLGIPVELEEAALIDGCNRLGILFRITIPLAKPALSALGIFTLLGSWNNFLWPLIVLQETFKWTLPIGLANMQATYTTSSYGILMAAAVVSSLPILVIFIILKKEVIRGVTLIGGIKK